MNIPGENIPGPHICMSVSVPHTHSMPEGQVQLSVVAHMTKVWVNVTGRIIVGVSGPYLLAYGWDGLDDVPPLACG